MKASTVLKENISAFIVGIIFSIGLSISGMTQPSKVIGFLNLNRNWDPSLAFVMIGALAVHILAYMVKKKMTKPVISSEWNVPSKSEITPQLILGSAIFGVGWGLAGYCPGPAIARLSTFEVNVVVFIIMLLFGMKIYQLFETKITLRK